MDDLISRRSVLEATSTTLKITGKENAKTVRLCDDIKALPPVDDVEVVRCKDCKYFDGECCDRYADETLGYSHSTQPNFFCACGERKTDG